MTAVGRILRVLGWSVAGALIAAFLVGYAAPYLPPARYWWTDLFAVLLPPLAATVGVLSAGLLVNATRGRRWAQGSLAAGLLVLILVRFGPRLVGDLGGSSHGPTMRLMTFNVPPTPQSAPAASSPLVTILDVTAPDVVAFQESWMVADDTPRARLLDTSTSLNWLLADSADFLPPTVLPPRTRIYQPVFGRTRLDSLRLYRSTNGGDEGSGLLYTRTRFRWAGRPAILYNIHLHTVGSIRPWRIVRSDWWSIEPWLRFVESYRTAALRRAAQARAIRKRIDREAHPVIVVGDFNSTPHQWVYRHLADGMADALQEGTWGPTPTFPAHRPLVQIDHVLAGPAWRVTAARVHEVHGPDPVSDHRPVTVALQWRGD